MSGGSASGAHFLSYSRADERFALRFAKDLRARGVAMWIDQLDIRPSEHWDRAVERAVRDCRGLVVILSPRSAASDNVADEISYAIEHRKPVLPVMIEKCTLPLRITRMHLIDATASYERALEHCIAELQRGGDETDRGEISAPRVLLDAQFIARAKNELTSILGPIASILVDKAALRASSAKDLYSLLALHIDNEADRERFAALTLSPDVSAPSQARAETLISLEELQRMSTILTTYLGPIAPIVTKRESQTASSLEDLAKRLANLIPSEPEGAEFLKRLQDGG